MPSELSIAFLSLKVALLATFIASVPALITAWLLARRNFRGKIIIDALVSLPLAVPPVVSGYALLMVFGGSGLLGRAFSTLFATEVVFTWVAAALAAALVSFPLIARTFMLALAGVDRRLEMAAGGLGATRIRVLVTITLPLASRGLLAGLLIGFVRSLSEFGATIVGAGNIPGRTQTLPLAIFTRISSGDDAAAIRLAVTTLLLGLIALIAHNYLLARGTKISADVDRSD